MSVSRYIFIGLISWLALVTLLHLWLNVGVFNVGTSPGTFGRTEFRVGFLPVT
jgi:hypothetical protein